MILKLDPEELLPIRVQYLADTDPFNSMAMYPVPSRAPTYSFVCSTPLATQLGAILRLLGAPQRVSRLEILFNKTTANANRAAIFLPTSSPNKKRRERTFNSFTQKMTHRKYVKM